ncbi:MAG TPA: hypothetical protein PLJ22_04095 [Kiritimatiellia bacterium]|nr:hypothetical protein [Kiritimatiellia bacterium]
MNAAGANSFSAGQQLRLARGFSSAFWSLPLMAALHAAALARLGPAAWVVTGLPASFLPLAWGLWLMMSVAPDDARWRSRVRRVGWLTLITAWLSPFLPWWLGVPQLDYLAVNAGLHYLLLIACLMSLNGLAAAYAARTGDTALRREAFAGLWMVLWLSLCTVGVLLWLFHRAGLLGAGLPAILRELAELPREAQSLFLLPYAMTAYVLWRAKETGFRLAAE